MAILGEFTLRPPLLPASRAAMEDRIIWVLGILRLLESFWLGIDGDVDETNEDGIFEDVKTSAYFSCLPEVHNSIPTYVFANMHECSYVHMHMRTPELYVCTVHTNVDIRFCTNDTTLFWITTTITST